MVYHILTVVSTHEEPINPFCVTGHTFLASRHVSVPALAGVAEAQIVRIVVAM